jgi:succinoglycan biosynthesis protein ExoV
MQLIYYKKGRPNFGDDLNALIWPALQPELFAEDDGRGFVGIGTIIGMKCGDIPELNVFSSGFGYDLLSNWEGKQVHYHCVRGPVSAKALGLPETAALTDGAVLTPLVEGFPRAAANTAKTIVIPHFETLDFPGWEEAVAMAGYELVDPRGDPVSVIEKIAAAGFVLTESLHGAILADTYGVPWAAFAASGNFSVAKWVDWTRSLGRDFTVTMLPPPDAGGILKFGRHVAPIGQTVTFGFDDALRQYGRQTAPPARGVIAELKNALKRSPLIRPLLGCNPARTAEALQRLATVEAQVTERSVIQNLQEQMLERLRNLAQR